VESYTVLILKRSLSLRSKRSCAFLAKGKPRNISRSASARLFLNFFALSLFFARLSRALAYLDRFLGFPFAKNAQERLLRRLEVTIKRLCRGRARALEQQGKHAAQSFHPRVGAGECMYVE